MDKSVYLEALWYVALKIGQISKHSSLPTLSAVLMIN